MSSEFENKILKELKDIKALLNGNPMSDKPEGLKYDVSLNTKFRKALIRFGWTILAANAGLITAIIIILINIH